MPNCFEASTTASSGTSLIAPSKIRNRITTPLMMRPVHSAVFETGTVPLIACIVIAPLLSRLLRTAVDQPRRSEPVGEHAEALRPKGLLQRHLDLAAIRKCRVDPLGFRNVGEIDRHHHA